MTPNGFSEVFHTATKKAFVAFEFAMKETERTVLDSLQVGEPVPKISQPTGYSLDVFSEELKRIRNDLKNDLATLKMNTSRLITLPLSPEDAANLQTLAMRDNVTQPELDAYYDTYKGKPNAIGMLDSVAEKNALRARVIDFNVPDYQTIETCINRINPSYIGGTPSNLRFNEDVVNHALGIRRNDAYVPIFFD